MSDDKGKAQLFFGDPNQDQAAVSINQFDDGSCGLHLGSPRADSGIDLATTAGGGSIIGCRFGGNIRILLEVLDHDRGVAVRLIDRLGNQRLQLRLDESGAPIFVAFDDAGNACAPLGS